MRFAVPLATSSPSPFQERVCCCCGNPAPTTTTVVHVDDDDVYCDFCSTAKGSDTREAFMSWASAAAIFICSNPHVSTRHAAEGPPASAGAELFAVWQALEDPADKKQFKATLASLVAKGPAP